MESRLDPPGIFEDAASLSRQFDLERRMVNAEIVVQPVGEIVQERIARVPLRHDQMGCEGGFGGAHRPDVQVVDRRYARLFQQR